MITIISGDFVGGLWFSEQGEIKKENGREGTKPANTFPKDGSFSVTFSNHHYHK